MTDYLDEFVVLQEFTADEDRTRNLDFVVGEVSDDFGRRVRRVGQTIREPLADVVLDLMMPVMDGFDFLFEFRLREDWASVPVIVVTAKDLTQEDRDRLNGGVERIFEKGALTRAQLLDRVRKFVEKHSPAHPPSDQ